MVIKMVTNKRLINAHDLWSDIMMLPHNGDMISSEEVEQAIVEAPTVDAVEVVHGWWIDKEEKLWNLEKPVVTGWECSKCGVWGHYTYNYCPNCGADMRERKDND